MTTDTGKPVLTAFIRARLDEEQARAEAMEHETNYEDGFYSCPAARTEPLGDLEWGEDHCWCMLAERKAKRLREIKAMREILRWHDAECTCSWCTADGDDLEEPDFAPACPTLCFLAAIWSDHPDYEEQWKL